jgi:hypothetical protein
MINIRIKTKSGTTSKERDLDWTVRSILLIINLATASTIMKFVIKTEGCMVMWTNGDMTCYATGPEEEMTVLRHIAKRFAEVTAPTSSQTLGIVFPCDIRQIAPNDLNRLNRWLLGEDD